MVDSPNPGFLKRERIINENALKKTRDRSYAHYWQMFRDIR